MSTIQILYILFLKVERFHSKTLKKECNLPVSMSWGEETNYKKYPQTKKMQMIFLQIMFCVILVQKDMKSLIGWAINIMNYQVMNTHRLM